MMTTEKSILKRFNPSMSRRQFLALSSVSAVHLIAGCANIRIEPSERRKYNLPQNKIQPLQNGMYIGFHGLYDTAPTGFSPQLDKNPGWAIEVYERELGYKPDIITRYSIHSDLVFGYSTVFLKEVHRNGVIPFQYLSLIEPITVHRGLSRLVDNKEFDRLVEREAKKVYDLKIPHFVSTMRELNGGWFPWGKQPQTAKKVWIKMWQIFEDNGANEYATWVFEPYVTHHGNTDNPERYFPGDQYVDWIGLSVYSKSNNESGKASLSRMVYPTYKQLYDTHQDIPIMLAEFGKTKTRRQDEWIDSGLQAILDMDIRGAVFWNNENVAAKDDHTLTNDSLEVFKKYMRLIKG